MFVRADLSHPQQAVQACHAVIEASTAFDFGSLSSHPHLVILSVPDQASLEAVKLGLERQSIAFREFIEPDLDFQVTAVCTTAVHGELRKTFRKFTLLKG